ncbi:MAG TPA: hypothetical protein VGG02_07050 [Chthoniobacterales bacterium]
MKLIWRCSHVFPADCPGRRHCADKVHGANGDTAVALVEVYKLEDTTGL